MSERQNVTTGTSSPVNSTHMKQSCDHIYDRYCVHTKNRPICISITKQDINVSYALLVT